MKRQMSISIFLAILVIVLAWIYIKYSNDIKPDETNTQTEQLQQKNTENAISISQEYTIYKYYIKANDGRLVVYDAKTQQLFAQTAIEIYNLPEEIKKELETGIFFQTEAELYDFLESYSS